MEKEFVYITKGEQAGYLRELPNTEAHQIKESGNGHLVNMQDYRKYEARANDALNEFKRLEKKVKESKDPRDTYEAKQYTIKQAEEQLDATIKEIDAEWETVKAQIVEDAKQSIATYSVKVSDSDKQIAEQFTTRYAVQLAATASELKQKEILMQMEREIHRLNDAQKTALQKELLALKSVAGVSIGSVLRAASDMTSPELTQVKAAEAMPFRASHAYHQMKLIRESHRNSLAGNLWVDKR